MVLDGMVAIGAKPSATSRETMRRRREPSKLHWQSIRKVQISDTAFEVRTAGVRIPID
jgi:hypothetical protein